MALSIMTNPTALVGQSASNRANNSLSKTIGQLSTGLRINSSADDASGLAVADKLAGQISGLAVASRNAQDGLSYLQTAEAAMGTMTSMVQRIRELAVQAGDPAYTTNDRVVLQTEVDQLIEEIDRVSSSAEFNTKKLLNGDASALWTATEGIEALVSGAAVSGNYDIETNMNPGSNYVYKSNIMTIGAGKTSFDLISGTGITRLDNIEGVLTDATKDIDIVVAQVAPGVGAAVTTVSNSTITGTAAASAGVGGITADGAFSIEVEALKDVVNTSGGATANGTARFRVTNMITGEVSEWQDMNSVDKESAAAKDVSISASATVVTAAFASVGLVSTGGFKVEISAGMTVGQGFTATERTTADLVINNTGNKVLGSFGSMGVTGDPVGAIGANIIGGSITMEMEATGDMTATGAGFRYRVTNMETGQQSDWFESNVNSAGVTVDVFGSKALNSVGLFGEIAAAGTVITTNAFSEGDKALYAIGGTVLAKDGVDYASVQFGEGPTTLLENPAAEFSNKPNKIYTAQMDDAGKVYYGKMDLAFPKGGVIVPGTSKVTLLGEGDAASEFTRLDKLSNFINDDGRQVLDNTRELTIYGNNKQATLSMEATDTVSSLAKKFSDAIVEALDLGAAGAVNANLVKFIGDDDKTTGGNQAVEGTFILQGAAIGAASKLSFSADQGVLGGLGFETIQEGQGSEITATVKDAHTGVVIGSDTVTDGILRNVLQNVDVKLDQDIGSKALWNNVSNSLSFVSTGLTTSTLHIVDNATRAAIGANEGQTLDISIGRLDSQILNLSGTTVLSFDDAQSTITKADQAIEYIAASRAVVGAQMNRLDFTITNLDVSRENMLIAESRIRDLDIAEASSRLAAEQVLLQSASAMLAQANQLPSYAAQLLR